MKKAILLYLVLFSITSCEKREEKILISDLVTKTQYYDNEIFNDYNQKIYGKWKFIYAFGGIAGTKIDPTYDCYLEVVRFGIYVKIIENKVYEYGQLIISKQDENETKIEFFPADIHRTDYFLEGKSIRFKGSDTLILWDGIIDGYEDYYKRIK
jgi:hypothetical protein